MYTSLSLRRSRSLGFSLIEVLVGIAISMVGLLVMYKTVTLWNSRTQATIAGGDAQIAGTLAIYALERDLKLAGMGFSQAAGDLGCTVQGQDGGTPISFSFLPIEIVDGTTVGPGVADEIHVLYGSSPIAPLRQIFQSSTPTQKTMTNTRNGFQAGDLAVVTDGIGGYPSASNCLLVEITGNSTPGGFFLDHAPGSYANYYAASAVVASRFNTTSANASAVTAFTAGNMYSLGPTPHRNVWSVVGETLQSSDTLNAASGPATYAEEVVDMKAFYGIDTPPFDKQISNAEWTKAPPAATDWSHLLAVRVSLLIRSRNYEKPVAAGDSDAQSYVAPNPVYTVASGVTSIPTNFVMHDLGSTVDTSPAGPTNWRYYRYRVYERVIPLRNMLWCNHVPTC